MQPLKDQFFSKTYITTLAADVKTAAPDFDAAAFTRQVLDRKWKNRELKDRMHHVADCLHAALNHDYKSSIRLLTPIVQQRIKEGTNSFGDMIFPDFVERFGLEDFKTSVRALEVFTAACSSEFAVRPFIVRYPQEMMQVMLQWSKHKSEHVRRLASEGCRPRLPWAMALPEFKKDPRPVLKILENLKSDTSEYVRRSVANNLNDISKDNLEVALKTAERWAGSSAEVDALVRHALRNELKKGNPRALKLFALATKTKTQIRDLKVSPAKIKIGDAVRIEFSAVVAAAERLRLEYWVFFVKAGGSTSKKVFQITEREFEKGSRHNFSKKHRFQNFTTRKHYAGAHRIVVAVNGEQKAETQVLLQ
ncbi:DNA alkylation repair protein [Turneriella parva]|uniref:DNA-3-methylpurine glycosylase n=1 Tax=Turneriella parva (strain ATCC BAA-1111 / DSM 21527 / NCTC 11395 / H) TaxID=869212 RepID=I4B529_TURPD|nr:DNA alkylation repair protein [Turneriella parva]AFM12386.1 DNA-3-methylpurine glycosylase [Turneriella parva DSM 21527]